MNSETRVRFAPSPTGALHIGNLRTALFNWLYAKKNNGAFILRIEDTDAERFDHEAENGIMSSLRRLGLVWSEGPDVGGQYAPYRQSQRKERYKAALNRLVETNAVYPCFCSPEELEAERKALMAAGKPPRYQGKCKGLTNEERSVAMEKKGPPSYRFRAEGDAVEFMDGVRGPISFQTDDIGDFIVVRSDGAAAFHLASAVDDIDMRITDVIRGEDHLSNTPMQILIARALGAEPPRYHHLSIILDRENKKLSKRTGSLDVAGLLESGYVPEAINTAVAMLGWSGVSGDEPEELEAMAARFDLSKVSKAPCHFDPDRLDHINAKAMNALDAERLLKLFTPALKAAGFPFESFDNPSLLKIAASIRDTIHSPAQAPQIAEMFVRPLPPDGDAVETLSKPEANAVLEALADSLSNVDRLDDEAFRAVIQSTASAAGVKGKSLYHPIRAAVTGRTSGPQLADIFAVAGKDEIIRRVQTYLAG